jgi:hypothetical protein
MKERRRETSVQKLKKGSSKKGPFYNKVMSGIQKN